MRAIRWAAVASAMAVCAGASGGTEVPPSVQSPQRIVCIVPAVTEMLFAIGAGDQVIGISSYDRYPPEALTRTRVGALVDPDVERILALRPDLAIVYGTQSDLIARLSRAGIPTFEYEHAGLADITTTIDRLGKRVGRSGEARRVVADIEAGIADVRRRVAGRPRPRTALIFEREPGSLRGMYASAARGFLHDMLDVAGGADVFGDVDRQSLQVSIEVLLARAPEVIIELQPEGNWTPDRLAHERSLWNSLAGLPAVRANRIHILVDEALPVPGPRVVHSIRLLADTLHPNSAN